MKKIMFISPSFFSIEDAIINGFEKEGHKVYHYDERMKNTKFNKILIRLFPSVLKKKIDAYYNNLYSVIVEEDIDVLLVIKSETMPIWFIKKVKELGSKVSTIHYMYDPIENYPKILEKVQFFDHALTFDKSDADKYGWVLRPLYYPPSLDQVSAEIEYDASFIGTIHTDRTKVLEAMVTELNIKKQHNIYRYYYLPMRLMYFYNKYFTRYFSNLKYKDFSTIPLTRNETDIMLKKSKHILDVHHLAQTGLTSRTIETIGAKRKLITTNPAIKDYDFYNDNNILVVDRVNPKIPLEWLEKDYLEISYDIMKLYTIEGFVKTFIDITK